jgi:hypothetical protein
MKAGLEPIPQLPLEVFGRREHLRCGLDLNDPQLPLGVLASGGCNGQALELNILRFSGQQC